MTVRKRATRTLETTTPGGRGSALDIVALSASYGRIRVLRDLNLSVRPGEVVALLGANGAGKTTTLRSITGQIRATGQIDLDGTSIMGTGTGRIVRRGVAHVPEGRGTFPGLTVEENLRAGGATRSPFEIREDIEHWYAQFPRLSERRAQTAGSLSGGEQQMLAVARAMMSRPTLLLLDEVSTGLAPNITRAVFDRLRRINAEHGTSMLIVEQNAHLALSLADRGYVLEAGSIVLAGTAEDLKTNDLVRHAYLRA